MKQVSLDLIQSIGQAIYDKKGFNILAIDVRDVCSFTDFFIIAEGNVEQHVLGITDTILDQLGKIGEKPIHMEGTTPGEWVVLDYGEAVIHLFIPFLREKYQLEKLWSRGKIVDLNLTMGMDRL